MRRGLIVELRSFFDTIDMVEQLTGRDLIGPLRGEAGSALRPPLPEPSTPAGQADRPPGRRPLRRT